MYTISTACKVCTSQIGVVETFHVAVYVDSILQVNLIGFMELSQRRKCFIKFFYRI